MIQYKLTGDDAIAFINSLLRPTEEEIIYHDKLINMINNDVKITDTQDGFRAEIRSFYDRDN